MLKEAQNSSNTLRLVAASVLLAFTAATFIVLHIALAFIPLRYYLPSVAEPLLSSLNLATGWLGLTISFFWNPFSLLITLILRFILLGTVVTTLIFLVKPPRGLIARGALEKFSEATPFFNDGVGRWLAYYYGLIFVFGVFGEICRRFEIVPAIADNMGYIVVETAWAILSVYLASILLISVWSFGSKLAYPVLKSSTDE